MPGEPRNLEAEAAYRAAWAQWLLATTSDEREVLEYVMDLQQPKIATGPNDPCWKRFTDTLPGFQEVWSRMRQEVEGKVRRP